MRYNTHPRQFTHTRTEDAVDHLMMVADDRDVERNRRGGARINKQREKMRRDRRDREWDDE